MATLVTPKKAAAKGKAAPAKAKPVETVEEQQPKFEGVNMGNEPIEERRDDITKTPPKLDYFYKQYMPVSTLGTAGQHYVDDIVLNISKAQPAITIKHIPIITPEVAAYVFYNQSAKKGVCLIFAETYSGQADLPPTERLKSIVEYFKQQTGMDSLPLAGSMVVIPEECTPEYATKMANAIINLLIGDMLSSDGTFNMDILSGETFQICTNQAQVREYIAKHTPHIVPDRNDVGFLVKRMIRLPNGNLYPAEPLFAVSGYTKFITPYDRSELNAKIIPIPTITSIVSPRPVDGYLPFALAMATQFYLIDGMWLEAYKTFAKDKPNLGNLVEGLNRPVENMNDLNQLVIQFFDQPRLCLDITEGRYNIPGMVKFGHKRSAYDRMQLFFGNHEYLKKGEKERELLAADVIRYEPEYNTYNGIITDKVGLVDTRNVDYLSLASNFERDSHAILNFKVQPMNPSVRIKEISEHYPNTRLIYNTMSLVFGQPTIRYIANEIANASRENGFRFTTDYVNNMGNNIYASQIAAAPTSWHDGMFNMHNHGMNNNFIGRKDNRDLYN